MPIYSMSCALNTIRKQKIILLYNPMVLKNLAKPVVCIMLTFDTCICSQEQEADTASRYSWLPGLKNSTVFQGTEAEDTLISNQRVLASSISTEFLQAIKLFYLLMATK